MGDSNARADLRALLATQGLTIAVGAVTPIAGLICKYLNFTVLYMGGSTTEATYFGHPDLGLKTLSESVSLAARIADVTGLPLICDGEAGFGDFRTVRRAVKEFEKAGVAGIHIEDQVSPPNGPELQPRRIIPRDQAVNLVKAAVDARTDADFVIIARTDADEISVDEVVERCNLFFDAGADMVMPILFKVNGHLRQSLGKERALDALRLVKAEVRGPIAGVGFSEFSNARELEEFGIKLYFYGAAAHQASLAAMFEVLSELAKTGTTNEYFKRHPALDPSVISTLLRTDEWLGLAAKYGE